MARKKDNKKYGMGVEPGFCPNCHWQMQQINKRSLYCSEECRHEANMRRRRAKKIYARIDLVRDRLDDLGWPGVIDLSALHITFELAGIRTQAIPKVMAALGYTKHRNTRSQSGSFMRRTKGSGDVIQRTLYRATF